MSPATRREYAAAAGRLAAVARGRLAARGRVPVRAARRALGDRRHRADHAPEGAARPLPLRLARTSAAGSATCCASTSPSTSPSSSRRDRPDPALRARCCAATASTCSPASRSSCARPRSPRRCCSRSSASCSSATRGRCCAPSCPARRGRGGPPRATRTSTASRPPSWPRPSEPTPSIAIQAPDNTTRAGRRRPGADRARGARAGAGPRGGDAPALVRDALADAGRRAAGRHGHGRVRRASSAARRSSTATTRRPPGASCAPSRRA